jgi:transcriptional regulator GlxA family with amidase domain
MADGFMSRARRRVGIIAFPGVNAIDIAGPLEVFATAGRGDGGSPHSQGAYETLVIGLDQEPFRVESGLRMLPDCTLGKAPHLDTLIIPGGWGLRVPATCAVVGAWLRQHAGAVRRVCAVCTGIYGLAHAGLLDGRRATTHWRLADEVARRFPGVQVHGDAIFIRDGRFYTSGGITAGIDLALALVEEDLGSREALAVARELLVYLKRPGGQDQFSEPLRWQARSARHGEGAFADLVAWVHAHLQQDLSVEHLAARVGMSPRHFSRRFTAAMGCTPGQMVERARLDAAREHLLTARDPVERIAVSVGFGSADVFRRRFAHRFGVSPRAYRERFTAAPPADRPEAERFARTPPASRIGA